MMHEPHGIQRGHDIHGTPQWLVTRYDWGEELLTDERLHNDMDRWARPEQLRASWLAMDVRPKLGRLMLFTDDPDHARLRRLIAPAFTARRTQAVHALVQEEADRLLHTLGCAGGTTDLVEDFAYPFSIAVLCRMAGFPEDFERAYRRRRLFTAGITSVPVGSPERDVNAANHRELVALLEDVIEEKRRRPTADLVTGLVEAEGRPDGLSHDELTSALGQLVIAGMESVARFLAQAFLVLLDHPEQLADLRADPGLVHTATDELIRFITPNRQASPRYPTMPLDVCGVTLQPGDKVCVMLRDANRDPLRFTDPERLDLRRDEGPHLAFGRGVHHCPGAPLAALEGQIAITSLLRELPGLRLAVPREDVDTQDHLPILGGPVAVPVTWRR
ncbi:cytochrome P450 [Actinomadura harenae]|uniref:Cytochrome P450 n=1 Tax=Actinomadura harenae TaxID=2483351 RepID=A0A3M2M0E2_9ACTN|nr:cytochrome P450 [Actinomadura harenae]RMI42956.1 cytochrome P450 [Actinomadura harenae]